VKLVALFPSPTAGDAATLARVLGKTEYEARLWLAAAMPRVVARLDDAPEARRCVDALAREGFDARLIDDDEIVPARAMVAARAPVVDAFGLRPNGPASPLTIWGEFAAFVEARHHATLFRSRTELVRVREARGAERTVMRERMAREPVDQLVLYLFLQAGAPWLVCENDVRYAALGVPLGARRHDNFVALVERIRAAAPLVPFDTSLVQHAPPGLSVAAVHGEEDATTPHDRLLDVAAHLCALSVTRTRPFR